MQGAPSPGHHHHHDEPSPSSSAEVFLYYRGVRVRAKHSATGISWKPAGSSWACCVDLAKISVKLPYEQVLSAWQLPRTGCCCPKEYSFVIYSFTRRRRSPCEWRLAQHVLSCRSAEVAKEWVGLVNGAVALDQERPKSLLVFVNPHSGCRRAPSVWERTALPILTKARVKLTVVETHKQDHATEVVSSMKAEELAGYGGIVAVGGDGMFQELIRGVMAQRQRGGANAAAAQRMRLGHIPAGSTDAVGWSLHGSRSAETATLHIAMGDRLPLDVARMDTAGEGAEAHGQAPRHSRSFCCMASYGFMGDVMEMSESIRCMGPSRYDLSGALQFLQHKSYRASVAYRPAAQLQGDVQQVCTTKCEACRIAGLGPNSPPPSALCDSATMMVRPQGSGDLKQQQQPALPQSTSPVSGGLGALGGPSLPPALAPCEPATPGEGGWQVVEGEFMAVMAVACPCRSDKSRRGVIPNGHLSDGRLYLVLVSRCSHLQYLRFLIKLSTKGLTDNCLPFVRVIPVTALQVTAQGQQSAWNVDGELLRSPVVRMRMNRGLVDVFARGIETASPAVVGVAGEHHCPDGSVSK